MRTRRRVIVWVLLLSACTGLSAQDAAGATAGELNMDVTVVGRDDTVIEIPAPAALPPDLELPAFDDAPPEALPVPAIQPPAGLSASRPIEAPLPAVREDWTP